MPDVTPRRGPIHGVSVQATADLIGGRFVAVTANNTGPGLNSSVKGESNVQVGYPAAGGAARGVLGRDTVNDDIGPCFDSGTLPVLANATIAAGAKVMSDASGRAIPWVTAASEANESLGICEDGVTSGQYALVKLNLA